MEDREDREKNLNKNLKKVPKLTLPRHGLMQFNSTDTLSLRTIKEDSDLLSWRTIE